MQTTPPSNIQPIIDYDPNDFVSYDKYSTLVLPEQKQELPLVLPSVTAAEILTNQERCHNISSADLEAMKKRPNIPLKNFKVKRHSFFNPVAAAKHNATCLNMERFESALSYRTMQAMRDANPLIPVSLMGCGSDNNGQKKINDAHFKAGYSYLQNVDLPCLIEMVEKMPPKHRNFCTLVLPNKPVHVYLDFDAGADAEKPHKQAMYTHVQGKEADVQRELRQRFSAYFQQVYNREPNLSGMHWETASCANKFSLHAHITTEAFANIDHLKVFMTGLIEYIVQQPGESCLYLRHPNQHNETEVVSLMDAGVYTKNRCFRLIECCKPGWLIQ